MKYSNKFYVSAIVFCFLISCTDTSKKEQSADIWNHSNQLLLADFNNEDLSFKIAPVSNATATITEEKALQIEMKKGEVETGVEISFNNPINTKQFKNFSLLFDISNLSNEYSAQLYTRVVNEKGQSIRRSASIASKDSKTFFMELAGKYINKNIGFKDDPNPWKTDAIQMKVIGGKNGVVFNKIASIHFKIQHLVADRILVIDNLRLIETPEVPEDFLVNVIDKYGQYAHHHFDDKITSDTQLKALADKELNQLAKEGPMQKDRSKFGGWLKGEKQKSTGFFRTEKVDKKWMLVDPEGYPFFSTGIANVRMANTTTFTGRDYKTNTDRDKNDVTPEDSKGMVKLPKETLATAFVAHEQRFKMFQELPKYDSGLGNHYSYRKDHFLTPFVKGETFSFYQANLERKYCEATPNAHLEKWQQVTLDRFQNWGFTSFGNWAGVEFYNNNRIPYFANGWIIGNIPMISAGYWGAELPDVFDPKFLERTEVTMKTIAKEVQNNPWCIGVFVDNEKPWGLGSNPTTKYGVIFETFKFDASKSSAKKAFINILKEKYKSISELNKSWETNIKSWNILENKIDLKNEKEYSENFIADFSSLMHAFASKYFSTVQKTLKKHMPNHLYMGARLAGWGMNMETVNAVAKYTDVMSYNFYEEGLGSKYWHFLEDVDRPSIIGEFHMGSAYDASVFNHGLIHAANQKDRGRMYKKYMETVIDNPYFVGAHWFQYTDSPVSGRAFDGENYNVGFVSNTDIPYKHLVNAAKEVNENLYERRFKD